MQFPSRDLTLQYISSSYQDVVQQYIPTGSTIYLLDGYGNVIVGIVSASLGRTVVTSEETASWAQSASWAPSVASVLSSSWSSASLSSSYSYFSSLSGVADVALLAGTASLAVDADFSISSSWSSASLSSSFGGFARSSSFSGFSNSSSWGEFAPSASWSDFAKSASWAQFSPSSSYSQTASFVNPFTSSWATQAVTSSGILPLSIKTTNYTLTTGDFVIVMSGSTNLTAALPTAVGRNGKCYHIKNVSSLAVFVSGSQTIDGETYQLIPQWNNMNVISDGTRWLIL